MKVSFNIKFIEGPFGGSMQFAQSFKDFLKHRGGVVVNDLSEDDIDIILHIAPFPFQEISSYTYIDAYRYKLSHPNVQIIERINECDERRGTKFMNRSLIDASHYSDHIVFIASWLKPLLESQGLSKDTPSSVILNGADHKIFNTQGKKSWDPAQKMKIVTHHWGANSMKGHDTYLRLDALLSRKEFSDKFEFTFVGNIPKDVSYQHTKIVPPLAGNALAAELRSHDVYITASKNEPAGMHHIEGALCGLPILYIESGALPEYCHNYGIGFNEKNLEERLWEMRSNYKAIKKQLELYPHTSERMNTQYMELFEKLLNTTATTKPSLCKLALLLLNSQLKLRGLQVRLSEFLRAHAIK